MYDLEIVQTNPASETPNPHCWYAQITATATDSADPKIFVMHSDVTSEGITGDTFDVVASVQQMTEIPADTPTAEVPYYRTAVMELNARSPVHREEFIEKILFDVKCLATNVFSGSQSTDTYTVNITP